MNERVALVTGATSGLGFETAAQLADDYEVVFVTGRTKDKACAAIADLVDRTGLDVFVPIELDLDEMASVERAASALNDYGRQIDRLILNAGIAPPPKASWSKDGFERTVSSSLLGHHLLVARILESALLGDGAAIVIAGSEAATGSVPSFVPIDFHAFAGEHFGGDLQKAVRAQMRMDAPASYNAGNVYATAKVFVAHWAAELAERLPDGATVVAVSPGSVPETNAIRNGTFFMKYIMVPLFKLLPGMSHSVADGARRYLDGADRGAEVHGRFLTSRAGKMIGELRIADELHLTDEAVRKATWAVLAELVGVRIDASAVRL